MLTGEWVLVSPHRAKRPWQGKVEAQPQVNTLNYDPTCYLCPGNARISGEHNPAYSSVFVFENDFPALSQETTATNMNEGLLQAEPEFGLCRVICFSPDHSKSLANMGVDEIAEVVKIWQAQYEELGALPKINYVQIFENKGDIMGCSNPHPHGQIWSQFMLPNEIVKKNHAQKEYFKTHGRSLLADYLAQELDIAQRIIYQNKHFVVLVPFWAVWPFETMIVPKKHLSHLGQLSAAEQHAFAEAISKITTAYDRLFATSFPYSSGIHQAPTNNKPNTHWHMHMSFYPPLLRSAAVKKFMVGYEMFGMPQRDITPEQVAERLQLLVEI